MIYLSHHHVQILKTIHSVFSLFFLLEATAETDNDKKRLLSFVLRVFLMISAAIVVRSLEDSSS